MSENSAQVNTDAEVKPEDAKKEKKPHKNSVTKALIHLIDGETDLMPPELRDLNYPFRYVCYQTRKRDINTYLKIESDNSLALISKEEMAEEIYRYLMFYLSSKEQCHYKLSFAECLQLVTCWPALQKKIKKLPPAMGWSDTPGLVMRRLPFAKIPNMTDAMLENLCPEFAKILLRMENAAWFVWRIGALFDPLADRKQAAYIHGPPDCGKSQIQAILRRWGGASYCTLTSDDLADKFWKESLLGARICCVGEAASSFLNSSAFLAITGDSTHSINPKGTKKFNADLDTMFFFFSNEAPRIKSKNEIKLRVVSCKMESLNIAMEDRINEHAYQEILWNESQAFLSYCCEYYQAHKGLRHLADAKTLEESSLEKESWALDIFDSYFEVSEKDHINSSVFNNILTLHAHLKLHEAIEFFSIIERRYGITRGFSGPKEKRYRSVKGLRKKREIIAI